MGKKLKVGIIGFGKMGKIRKGVIDNHPVIFCICYGLLFRLKIMSSWENLQSPGILITGGAGFTDYD